MPRTNDPDERRKLYGGMGDGMAKAVDLVTATAVWAGIGYLIDRWLHTWPVCFAVGAVIGNLTGIYILYKRSLEESSKADSATVRGVSRTWPKRAAPASGGIRPKSKDQ